MEAPDSLPEAVWREEIARIVLESETPDAIPPGTAACVQLLRGVLAEIVNSGGMLPSKETMEEADNAVSELLEQGDGKPRGKKEKRKRKAGNKKQYKYARTQELYRQNPGQLAKYVKGRID